MIRVLQVLGGLGIGGAESMVMNYYRNIDRSKIQFDFIIHTNEHQEYYDEVLKLGGKIYSFPKFTGKNIFKVKNNWNIFFKEHPEYKIMHSHVRSYASIYLPIAKKHGVKTIIHSHSTSNGQGISSIVKSILQYSIRHRADYFFGCSQEAGEWLFGRKVVSSDRYFMMKNAIDIKKFEFSKSIRSEYRHLLGINENTNVFIHVGRFHPSKNYPFLINLFNEYHKNHNDSILILVGDGDLKPEIENQIQKLNISDYVILTGSKQNTYDYLQAGDCFLFPSNWEGLPVTVVEAQASGLNCLISDRITQDVNISELVQYISIDNGFNPWLEKMDALNFSRMDVKPEIIKSGFDITEASKWLESFYERLTNA